MWKLIAVWLALFLPGLDARAQLLVPPEGQPVLESLAVGESRLELQFVSGFDVAGRIEAREWIARSARAIARYFGKFPVPEATILIIPVDGDTVKSGTAFNDRELRIRVRVGHNVTREKYLADWIMVHEMVHLAIPEVPRNQNWFHEGAATYVEIIVRAKAGLSGSNGGWAELVRNLNQGMPQKGDRGLDHTPTWGRIYWGGAMFCLLADVELRKRSSNRVGLRDALRGIVASGGNYGKEWPLEKTLSVADEATGYSVLSDLHARMKDSASPPDLVGLWRDLGISEIDGVVVYSDDAPLSAIRRAITKAD